MKLYNIASHIVAIDYGPDAALEQLLPNLTPFLLDGEDQGTPVLTVAATTSTALPPKDEEIEVGHFDVGGCTHGVYRNTDGGYRIEIHDTTDHLCGRLISNANFSHCTAQVLEGTKSQQAYALNNCLMMSYSFATATTDTLLVHSSVIRCEGRGYMMTAPSGTGKSTHTRLWYDHIPGCDLMNDDNPIVRILPDGVPTVYGSPWSGKTHCYRNISAPIGGIVRLHQRPANSIRPLPTLMAFTELLSACSSMKWDARIYNGVCDSITKLVKLCRIWELGCLPNGDAAILCHDTIAQEHS